MRMRRRARRRISNRTVGETLVAVVVVLPLLRLRLLLLLLVDGLVVVDGLVMRVCMSCGRRRIRRTRTPSARGAYIGRRKGRRR